MANGFRSQVFDAIFGLISTYIQSNDGAVATITASSALTDVVTITAKNILNKGDEVLLAGTAEPALNGQVVTVVTATSTQFTFAFTIADYTNLHDTGTGTRWNYEGVGRFQTLSKNYRPYTKVPSGAQPSFFLALGPQKPDQDTTPGKSKLEMVFYGIIFVSLDPAQNDPSAAEVLLNVLDMVDDAIYNLGRPQDLASQNGGKPLVYNTLIDRRNGNVEIRQPILLQQGAIIIPITTISGQRLQP